MFSSSRDNFRGALWAIMLAMLFALGGCSGGKASKSNAVSTPAAEQSEWVNAGWTPIEIDWPPQQEIQATGFVGFFLYRAPDKNGPFVRITPRPLAPPPEEKDSRAVRFVDRGLPLNQTFYYYVEAVFRDGRRRKVTAAAPKTILSAMTRKEYAEWVKEVEQQAELERRSKAPIAPPAPNSSKPPAPPESPQ